MLKVNNWLRMAFNGHQIRSISSATAAITKIHRTTYIRQYPVVLVNPDGSSINIRYTEPRRIIRLPVDMTKLTEEERRKRMEARKPRISVKIEKDFESTFDSKKYLKYIRK